MIILSKLKNIEFNNFHNKHVFLFYWFLIYIFPFSPGTSSTSTTDAVAKLDTRESSGLTLKEGWLHCKVVLLDGKVSSSKELNICSK